MYLNSDRSIHVDVVCWLSEVVDCALGVAEADLLRSLMGEALT